MRKSLEEMCRLVTGYGAWHIGDIQVSDGPHGVRAQEDGAKNNDSYEATCFPTASSVACSWNPNLIGQMAQCFPPFENDAQNVPTCSHLLQTRSSPAPE